MLMENLLEYSRVNAQQRSLGEISLEEIARGVISDLEAVIEEKGAEITVGDLPVVEADGHQMRRLFQNLLSNALRFHVPNEPPVIAITSRPRQWERSEDAMINGEQVDICVEDRGIGISAEHRKKVFGMFQRLHDRTQYPGTGVGLAICERIVNQHNGSIRIEGGPGEGSRFIVTFPVKQGIQSEWE